MTFVPTSPALNVRPKGLKSPKKPNREFCADPPSGNSTESGGGTPPPKSSSTLAGSFFCRAGMTKQRLPSSEPQVSAPIPPRRRLAWHSCALRKALEGGYRDFLALDASPYLEQLRKDPRYQQLILQYRK